jgi:predicted chitinase
MLNGAGNSMGTTGASLRLLSFGSRPQQAPVAAPVVASPAASAPVMPAPTTAAAPAPRLLSQPASADFEKALEAVRQDASSFMTAMMNQLTTSVLPALSDVRARLAVLLSQSPAAPAPAPAAPAPAPQAPAPQKPAAEKPAAQAKNPKPAPKPKKKPASPADFKTMLGISNERLAKVLAIPADSARKNLPVLAQAIKEAGIKNKNAIIGILATIKTEVGSFQPINEYGGPGYWARYNGRSDLGNRRGTNDGVKYHGRGYIQLTGRANYQSYGKQLGVNLAKNPEKALDPKIAGKVLVQYFKNRGLVGEAAQGDWMAVRKGVNGGTNGWDTFIRAVGKLKKAVYK